MELLDRFKQGTLPSGVTDAQVKTRRCVDWSAEGLKKQVFVKHLEVEVSSGDVTKNSQVSPI